MEALISLQQVEKTYKIKGGLVHALRGIDFTVNQGDSLLCELFLALLCILIYQ